MEQTPIISCPEPSDAAKSRRKDLMFKKSHIMPDWTYKHQITIQLQEELPKVLIGLTLEYANEVRENLQTRLLNEILILGRMASSAFHSGNSNIMGMAERIPEDLKFQQTRYWGTVGYTAMYGKETRRCESILFPYHPYDGDEFEIYISKEYARFDLRPKQSRQGKHITADPKLMSVLGFNTAEDIGQIEPIETAREWQSPRPLRSTLPSVRAPNQ
jgi:hypothetical protein